MNYLPTIDIDLKFVHYFLLNIFFVFKYIKKKNINFIYKNNILYF